MGGIMKEQKQETVDDSFEADFKIPETTTLLAELNDVFMEELRAEHKFEMEEIEKNEPNKNKVRQRQGGVICCCGEASCRIGPMMERT